MGETRKVSAYPQLASFHLNIPLIKESQNDERYKVWVKKSMTKREDRSLLQKVRTYSYISIYWVMCIRTFTYYVKFVHIYLLLLFF